MLLLYFLGWFSSNAFNWYRFGCNYEQKEQRNMSRNARVTNSSELLRGRKWVDGLNTFQNIVHAQCTWRVSFKNGGFLDLSSVECFGWASANKRPPRREKREFSQINMWSLKMPARLCQQWRIQGRTGDPPPPYFSLFLNQTEARTAGKVFWDRSPTLTSGSGWPPPPSPPSSVGLDPS